MQIDIEKLRSQLLSVTVDGTLYYVAEGDLLISREEFEAYAEQRLLGSAGAAAPLDVSSGESTVRLIAVGEDGKVVRWAPGVVLSYHVRRETFPTLEQYETARDCVLTATEEWMETCGVEFRHDAQQDEDPASRSSAPSVFHVRYLDAGGRFIAAAFFPNQPPERRAVLIDPSFYSENLGFDRIGVLRHELGHTLGFRHEHIRSGAPPNCPKESLTGTIVVTDYDPRSVMHYFCGGVGSRELAITEVDRAGARQIYGAPLADFRMVRP
jgi:hypothetical protein